MSIEKMKTLTIGDITYDITDDEAVRFTEQDLTEEQKAQARANIGVIVDPNCHAEYFTVTDDGVVALKAEFRGASTSTAAPDSISDLGSGVAGSKNAELPKKLVIPEIINGTVVSSLTNGIFNMNENIESVTLPDTITEIPDRCFNSATNLTTVLNTENIKSVGRIAFQATAIRRINFPNLECITDLAPFNNCGRLIYADIGKVTNLPDKSFSYCVSLNMVKSANCVKSVGEKCFTMTPNLRQASFVSGLTNIGKMAFLCSGVNDDWSTLTGCTFGIDSTNLQYNPTDFWSTCTPTSCENRLPTLLSQSDPRWADRQIGTSGITYSSGCMLMGMIHAYCGLHNLSLPSVEEFETIAKTIDQNSLNGFTMNSTLVKPFFEKFMTVTEYTAWNQTVLQTVYDALSDGKYVLIALTGRTETMGHAVLVYGVNDKGEFLIADSAGRYRDDKSLPLKYRIAYHKLTADTYSGYPRVWIFSK